MSRKRQQKGLLFLVLSLMLFLAGYKVYLAVYEKDFQSLNAVNLERIEKQLQGREAYSFAVVGNIRNSMRIFEKRIVPLVQNEDVDFIVSAGNSVYDGAEDKYRLLYRGLGKLDIPYVLAVGHNELEDFGAPRFYRHFGPFFFSFRLGNAAFLFLDSTGRTSWEWLDRWLAQELEDAAGLRYRFVFLNDSPFAPAAPGNSKRHYLLEEETSRKLQRMFAEYHVTAVFSAGYPTYDERVSGGVRYIVSGGAGGLLLDGRRPYQIVKVEVGPEGVTFRNIAAGTRLGLLGEKFETVKLFLRSFFTMSLLNFLLVLGIAALLALKLYGLILKQENLYRDFSIDEGVISEKPLRVAMFTNNYLPFIGGVPLSIDRLFRGLIDRGATVKLFAPAYRQRFEGQDQEGVFRCPALFFARTEGFPVPNVFSRSIGNIFKALECDVVHVHHPFLLGGRGMRLAQKAGIPVVFTYHTRLEHYIHYLGLPETALTRAAAHLLIKHFGNKCDAIITPTVSTEEYLRHLGVSSVIETIPTGINLEEYRRWSPQDVRDLRQRYAAPEERLLISVSRMAKEKNLDFLLAGLVKVEKKTKIPFKCLLVGDGPEKTRLEKRAEQLGLKKRVFFTGNLEPREVVRHYLAADLFVFASTSETQGMVLVEAMAGGCPVVAVRASGVYDMVKDGFNGFKVAESTENWAKVVAGILEDNQLWSLLSRNSLSFAEGYSVEKTAGRVMKLYRRVLALTGAGGRTGREKDNRNNAKKRRDPTFSETADSRRNQPSGTSAVSKE